MKRIVLSSLCALAAFPALAVELEGVKVTDTVSVQGQPLVLNGAGVRTKMVFKVYVASLYLPAKAPQLGGVLAKSPRRLQLNMLRTLSADAFLEAFQEGLADNNTPAELATIKAGRDQLSKIMKDLGELKEGNVVALDFVDGTTTISLNGVAKGTISGAAFNAALMKIWLGAKPVSDDLKKQLLGS